MSITLTLIKLCMCLLLSIFYLCYLHKISASNDKIEVFDYLNHRVP